MNRNNLNLHIKIDIVLINYNNFFDTMECLESLKKCSYPFRNLFLIDNSEQVDITLKEYIRESSRIILIKTNKNLGFAGGNNLGIKEALKNNPNYILLLNNDTIVKEDFLENLIHGAIQENADIATGKIYHYNKPDVIWATGGWIDWGRGVGRLRGIGKKDHAQFDKTEKVSFISGCMILIKKDVFDKIGLLNERYFMYHEDLDFCLRALKANFRLVYIPSSIIWHKVGATNINKSPFYFYYFLRNSIFIVKNYANSWRKTKFLLYGTIFYSLKLCLASIRNLNFIPVFFKAIKDGLFNKEGKLQ